jgi:hypothetical protein
MPFRRMESPAPEPSWGNLCRAGGLAKGRQMCKIPGLRLIAGSQHLFETRMPIMRGSVMTSKEAGETL